MVGVPVVGTLALGRNLVEHVYAGDLVGHARAPPRDDRAEVFGEANLIRQADVLVPDEDHEVLHEGAPYRGQRRIVERFSQVKPDDLGADRRGERADDEAFAGHDRLLARVTRSPGKCAVRRFYGNREILVTRWGAE